MGKGSYLICYDICNAKRLQKIHKVVIHYAVPLQYSVYYGLLTAAERDQMVNKLQQIINDQADDIRIYPISGTTLADWPKIGSEGGDKFLLIT
jgi:CRISPR-associated protein Cas2